jgi:hypothetical protein
MTKSACVRALVAPALLTICLTFNAAGQTWAPTATNAFPVQSLPNATSIGPLPGSPVRLACHTS